MPPCTGWPAWCSAGEDPHYVFRRMLILASEDVGMADPNALQFVEAAAAAFDRVGMPEGRFHLAHATLYLATAPKSNSAMGFFDALALLESEQREGETPNHLRDANRDKEGFGHGEGYLYPHAFKDHWVAQQYLPSSLQGKVFYTPSDVGKEAAIREEVLRRREIQIATALDPPQRRGADLLFRGDGQRALDRASLLGEEDRTHRDAGPDLCAAFHPAPQPHPGCGCADRPPSLGSAAPRAGGRHLGHRRLGERGGPAGAPDA